MQIPTAGRPAENVEASWKKTSLEKNLVPEKKDNIHRKKKPELGKLRSVEGTVCREKILGGGRIFPNSGKFLRNLSNRGDLKCTEKRTLPP